MMVACMGPLNAMISARNLNGCVSIINNNISNESAKTTPKTIGQFLMYKYKSININISHCKM